MSSNEYAISLKTNRLVKKSTANYRRLKKLNLVKEVEEEPVAVVHNTTPEKSAEPEAKPAEPEFDERDLQLKLADISTSVVKKNMKQILKNQKLSDDEYDMLLKKMLYKKLCLDEPKESKKKPKPVKKKAKFKVVVPSSESESESESD
jgi:hypothetical protein